MNERKPAAPVLGGGGFLRVRLDLAYDGGPFSGWAMQPGLRTVQGVLEEALALLMQRQVRVTVAGRTDAGVHARGQVVHLDLTEAEWLATEPRGGTGSRRRAPAAPARRSEPGPGGPHRRHRSAYVAWRRKGSTPGSQRCGAGTVTALPTARSAGIRWAGTPRCGTRSRSMCALMNEGLVQAAGPAELPFLLQAPGRMPPPSGSCRGSSLRAGATASSLPPCRPMRSATTWCGLWWGRPCTSARGPRSPAGCYERLLEQKRDAKSVLVRTASAGAGGSRLSFRRRAAGPG